MATCLLKGVRLLTFLFFNFLNIFFLLFFPSAMHKKIKLLVILRGGYAYSRDYVYCFCQMLQGLRLLFLPNVPGATFIQGGTFIPESRVSIVPEQNNL